MTKVYIETGLNLTFYLAGKSFVPIRQPVTELLCFFFSINGYQRSVRKKTVTVLPPALIRKKKSFLVISKGWKDKIVKFIYCNSRSFCLFNMKREISDLQTRY